LIFTNLKYSCCWYCCCLYYYYYYCYFLWHQIFGR